MWDWDEHEGPNHRGNVLQSQVFRRAKSQWGRKPIGHPTRTTRRQIKPWYFSSKIMHQKHAWHCLHTTNVKFHMSLRSIMLYRDKSVIVISFAYPIPSSQIHLENAQLLLPIISGKSQKFSNYSPSNPAFLCKALWSSLAIWTQSWVGQWH